MYTVCIYAQILNYFAGFSQVINNTKIAIVELMLSCGRNYSFFAAGITSDGELIGPMLHIGEANAMCPNLPPSPSKNQ